MRDKAEDLAYGRWPEILQRAGMADTFFSGRHGPCPFCGGTDRYRWSNKYGGVWLCTMCPESGGSWADGFKMLMKHMGYPSFRAAADHVRAHFSATAPVGQARRQPVLPRADPKADIERNLRRMNLIWAAARPIEPGDPVERYLQRRVPGLDLVPQMLRYHPALDYWAAPDHPNGRPVLLGRFPAMVARAVDPSGSFVQLHKTYLTPDGSKADVPVVKKTERGVGINGFAVPLMPVSGDTLGFSEGIESALAAAMVRRIPVWPCLNGPSMAAMDLPEHLSEQVSRIVIFADHDALKAVPSAADGPIRLRSAGSHYAEQLAERMRARGKRVLVVKAGGVGLDLADYWAQRQAAAGAA
jgi:putative DNA primase/helicase